MEKGYVITNGKVEEVKVLTMEDVLEMYNILKEEHEAALALLEEVGNKTKEECEELENRVRELENENDELREQIESLEYENEDLEREKEEYERENEDLRGRLQVIADEIRSLDL